MENEVLEAIKKYDEVVKNLVPMNDVGDVVQAGMILTAANQLKKLLIKYTKEN